ncbi:MAG: hypothetical protein WBA13_03660 [Microcoleaceae cyanobacterium]
MMFGAGLFSSSWGYKLGREALKEISQPDMRPSHLTGKKSNGERSESVQMLKEDDILKSIKQQMEGKAEEGTVAVASTSVSDPQPTPKPAASNSSSVFPIVSRDGGITMQVTSASRKGTTLRLKVSLKNEGEESVRFLYSFLNVTDDKGRALSASVDELPGQVPPDNKVYSGIVSIPTVLLENADELAMSLTDYPDQNLQLQMSGIPIIQ